ncbi:MAG: class I SAM-dependent methyltransferase [Candidatus Heimdallarchaeota archaeon]|nr:MAG: class I SAM-dependent methyltransferase [Candidatus Heimdallarchaeota archaeon]
MSVFRFTANLVFLMGSCNSCFDWASSFYDYSRAIPEKLMIKTIETLLKKVKIHSDSKILEIGVGTGRVAIPLSRKLKKDTIGMDISEKMLQNCRKKTISTDYLQLIVADGLFLPFSQNQFDIVLTCHVLHLLPNVFQFIEKMVPILVQQGYFINLEAYVNYHQTPPFEIYYGKLAEAGFHHNPRGDLVRRSLIIYLTKRGWNHIQYKIESEREISLNDLVRFIRDRVFSHQRAISDDFHQRSLKHLYNEIEKNNLDLSKKVLAPATSRCNIFQRSNDKA